MNRYLLPIIAVALFLSLFRLGAPHLFDVDEAVFSEATREMVLDHNWITPTYNGENRYDKPILFYWLMAASYSCFGINEFGARFPSAVSSVLLVSAIFLFTNRFKGRGPAALAALSAALSVYFLVYSRAAVTDMALALFISLSLFSFYLSTVRTDRRVFIYAFYLFSALAFLTKGLIGILFPFGIAIAYSALTSGFKGVRRVFHLGGILLFSAVSAPWYLTQVFINGREFIDQFFIKHHFRRYTGVISGHKGPFYYYIPVMIIGLFHWISFLPAGIRNTFKEKDRLDLFAFVWFAFVFLFFSLSTTKLPNYILPALPALCLLIGSGLSVRDERWRRYSLLAMGVLSALLGGALLVATYYLPKLAVPDSGWLYIAAAAAMVIAVFCVYASAAKKSFFVPVAVLTAVFLVVLVSGALPLASTYLQGTLHKYSVFARDRLGPSGRLVTYGINNPSVAFYSRHRMTALRTPAEIGTMAEKGGTLIVITKAEDAASFAGQGLTLIDKDNRYAILEKK